MNEVNFKSPFAVRLAVELLRNFLGQIKAVRSEGIILLESNIKATRVKKVPDDSMNITEYEKENLHGKKIERYVFINGKYISPCLPEKIYDFKAEVRLISCRNEIFWEPHYLKCLAQDTDWNMYYLPGKVDGKQETWGVKPNPLAFMCEAQRYL